MVHAVAVEGGAGTGHQSAGADPGAPPVSTSEPSTSEVSELPLGVSHLMTVDQLLEPGRPSICITLCGEDVNVGAAGIAPVEHCPSCDCVPRFCPKCVREACQWSTES